MLFTIPNTSTYADRNYKKQKKYEIGPGAMLPFGWIQHFPCYPELCTLLLNRGIIINMA